MKNAVKLISLAVGTSLLLACSQMTPEEQFAQAQEFFQSKEYGKAIVSAKQLVGESPRNPEYRVFLADLHLMAGDLEAAEKEYLRAAEYGIELSEISRSQVDLELFRNNYSEAIDILLERQGAFTDKAQWHSYAVVTALATDDNDLLKRSLAFLNDQGTAHSDFTTAAQMVLERDPKSAAELLLASNEEIKAPEFLFLIGSALVEAKEYKLAESMLEEYTQTRPQNRIANYFLAKSYLASEQLEKAKIQIDIVRLGNPSNALGQYVAALYHYELGELDTAAELAQRSIDGGFNNTSNYFIVGINAFENDNFERALAAFKYLESVSPGNNAIQRMLSAVQLRLGDVTAASQSLTQLENASASDIDIILMAGFQSLQNNQSDQVLSELTRYARDLDVESSNDSLGLALLNFANDESSGIAQLEGVWAEDSENINAFATLASAYVQTGNFEKAEALVNQVLAQGEPNLGTLKIVSNIYLQLGMLEKANTQYEKIRTLDPDNASVLMFDVINAERVSDMGKATSAVQKYIDVYPNDLRGYIKYKELLTASDAAEADYEVLFSRLAQSAVPEHKIYLGELLIARGALSRAMEVLNSIQAPTVGDRRDVLLAFIAMENSDAATALELVKPVLTVDPSNAVALRIALRANATRQGFVDNAQLLERAALMSPNNSGVDYLKAINFIAQGDYQKAQSIVDILLTQNDQLAVRALQGSLHLEQERFGEAYPYSLEAYQSNPSKSRLLSLVRNLNGLNKYAERTQLLNSYISNNPQEVDIGMLDAEYKLRENLDQGIKALESLLEKHPTNVVAMNNLSWAFLQQNNLSAADMWADKAIAINPNEHPFVLTKARVLIAQGKTDDALRLLETIIDISEGTPVKYAFDYLNILVDVGRTDQAKILFNQYVSKGVDQNYIDAFTQRLNAL